MNTFTSSLMNAITTDNLRYLAGLFDGEGNASVIHVQRRKSSPKRLAAGHLYVCAQKVPCLQLKMCSERPVTLLHATFGGSLSTYVLDSGKTVWVWRVSHRKALAAACALRPYVLEKCAQLDTVITYYSGRN